jgi:hypothetical protein
MYLVIKHYRSGTRRFFTRMGLEERRISGENFDVLISSCLGVSVESL